MIRQITSVVKLTVPTIGNWAIAQITAITSNTQRVSMRLTMKPTARAEIENRKKNEDPRNPNCSGSSCNSALIGTPARLTTILSAKLTSMNRNRRKVIFQAPLSVGCVVMGFPDSCFNGLLVGLAGCYPRGKRQCNWAFLDGSSGRRPGTPSRSCRRHD